jgi:hypothetical protein
MLNAEDAAQIRPAWPVGCGMKMQGRSTCAATALTALIRKTSELSAVSQSPLSTLHRPRRGYHAIHGLALPEASSLSRSGLL